VTPPVPDYPSTHTVLGAAAAEVLIAIFGDNLRYSMTSTSLPGVTRHFVGFSAAAMENGASRVYAGIHFARAVMHGYELGRNVGRSVSRMLPPGE
jgi:membrane-associated phospholipid phosphatase